MLFLIIHEQKWWPDGNDLGIDRWFKMMFMVGRQLPSQGGQEAQVPVRL